MTDQGTPAETRIKAFLAARAAWREGSPHCPDHVGGFPDSADQATIRHLNASDLSDALATIADGRARITACRSEIKDLYAQLAASETEREELAAELGEDHGACSATIAGLRERAADLETQLAGLQASCHQAAVRLDNVLLHYLAADRLNLVPQARKLLEALRTDVEALAITEPEPHVKEHCESCLHIGRWDGRVFQPFKPPFDFGHSRAAHRLYRICAQNGILTAQQLVNLTDAEFLDCRNAGTGSLAFLRERIPAPQTPDVTAIRAAFNQLRSVGIHPGQPDVARLRWDLGKNFGLPAAQSLILTQLLLRAFGPQLAENLGQAAIDDLVDTLLRHIATIAQPAPDTAQEIEL